MAKGKEIVNKETGEVTMLNAELGVDQAFMDALPSADASDYRVPNIVIIQPTSKIQGNAGELIDLNTKQVVGAPNEPMKFIPLWFYKTWETFHETPDSKGKMQRQFQRKDQFNTSNALWKWEEPLAGQPPGSRIRRYLITNLFLLLEKDLDSPMPQLYLYRFKGTSANEGKKLLTFWTNAKNYKQLPYSYLFQITPVLKTQDEGKYYVADLGNVMDGKKFAQIDGDKLKVAHGWVDMISKNITAMTQVNEAEDVVEETTAPLNATPETAAGPQLSF